MYSRILQEVLNRTSFRDDDFSSDDGLENSNEADIPELNEPGSKEFRINNSSPSKNIDGKVTSDGGKSLGGGNNDMEPLSESTCEKETVQQTQEDSKSARYVKSIMNSKIFKNGNMGLDLEVNSSKTGTSEKGIESLGGPNILSISDGFGKLYQVVDKSTEIQAIVFETSRKQKKPGKGSRVVRRANKCNSGRIKDMAKALGRELETALENKRR